MRIEDRGRQDGRGRLDVSGRLDGRRPERATGMGEGHKGDWSATEDDWAGEDKVGEGDKTGEGA